MRYSLILICFIFASGNITRAQTVNDLLNILVEQNSISATTADSLRADFSIRQQSALPDKKLRVDAEFRPRLEYRNGYQQLRNDSSSAALFVNQRFRVSLNYTFDNRFAVQLSVQDLRVWGQQDPRSTSGTLQVFEGWVEPFLSDRLSIRIGRQRLSYDNQRLFAENDWRLSGAVHDAVNFRMRLPSIVSELAVAFNQSQERFFGTDYRPSGFSNYKFLAVNYSRFQPMKKTTVTLINSADGYQKQSNPEEMFLRYTLGGRLEYESGKLYGTLSSYYQGGKNSSGTSVSAWYIQPEVRYTSENGIVLRLGGEIFSGAPNNISGHTSRAFVPLYGATHRFNGSMDLITRFPNDMGGAGLVNPYLFIIKPLSSRLEIRSDFHTFHLGKDFYHNDIKTDRYLGFENDIILSFRPNNITRTEVGFSWMLPTETFEIIKNAGSSEYCLTWFYVSFTFRPQLFSTSFK